VVAAIPSPGANGIHIGPVELHVYGLCYVVAIVAAIRITARRWG
jgi:prolipoprotein diacylglyceryltransferase